uniref:Amidase 1 n=1 Tax=Anthurium amnicola TaxID=1678845 RepID=A0A1D1XLT5_9ARAE
MEEGKDEFGAFMERFELRLPPPEGSSPSPELPLGGLTFAVKDIFDVSGYVTGFGNPDWARTHASAAMTSPAVMTIIRAGATCVGKTVMDEMAYSINGENKHYGTPTNPAAPDRVPGGSSSGSAVSVAAEIVDFSIGTDTGGSVRVPAAYCGIFGFRPSHGAVSTTGVIPMAQSFDTIGWFSRDPMILAKVGEVLLQLPITKTELPSKILIPEDCFLHLSSQGSRACQILTESVRKTIGCHVLCHLNLGEYIANKVPSLHNFVHKHLVASTEKQGTIPALSALSSAMRSLQRCEFKSNHGEWVKTVRPDLGPGIFERVWEAVKTTEEDVVPHCHAVRSELQAALNELLKDNGVLALPTVPGPPPKLLTEASLLENFRAKAFSLLSIAGMSGFCQVTIPLGKNENFPMSISLLGRHGSDVFLLNLVDMLYGNRRKQAVTIEKPVH